MYSMPLTDADRTFIKGMFLHLQYQQMLFKTARAMRRLMKEAFLSVQDMEKLQFLKDNKQFLPPEMSSQVKIEVPEYIGLPARKLDLLGFDLERLAQLDDHAYDNNILASAIKPPSQGRYYSRRTHIEFYYNNDEEPLPLLSTYNDKSKLPPFSTEFSSTRVGTFILSHKLTIPVDAIDHYPELSRIFDKLAAIRDTLEIVTEDIERKAQYVDDAVNGCRTTKQLDRLYPIVSDTLDYVYTRTHLSKLQSIAVIREAETISEAVRQAVDILAETYEWPVVDSHREAS